MTLAELRKGRKISQATVAARWGLPDADLAAGEAQGPAALHNGAHGGGDGWASDVDCNVPGSGAGGAGGSQVGEKEKRRAKSS